MNRFCLSIIGLFFVSNILYASVDIQLDSIVYPTNRKEVYTYNTDGKLSNTTNYTWISNAQKWDSPTYETYTYNLDGQIVSTVHTTTSSESNELVHLLKTEYSYDANGNKILEIEFNSLNDNWVFNKKTETVYDINKRVISESNYTWNNANWEYHTKTEYTYDEDGNQLTTIKFEPNSTQTNWRYATKESCVFTNRRITQNIRYNYDISNLQWLQFYKEEYEYDAASLLLQRITKYYWEGNFWSLFGESISLYNDNQQLISESYRETESLGSEISFKNLWTYDASGNWLVQENFNWNTNTLVWDKKWKIERQFNTNYTKANILAPPFFYSENEYMITKSIHSEWDNNQWMVSNNTKYYGYTQINTGIETQTDASLNVYFNAQSQELHILNGETGTTLNVQIWSMSGNLIQNTSVFSSSIALHNIPTGVYLYRIQSDKEVVSGKFSIY